MRWMTTAACIAVLAAGCGNPPPASVAVEDVDDLVSFYATYAGDEEGDALFRDHRRRLVESGRFETGAIRLPEGVAEAEIWSHAAKVFKREAFRHALLSVADAGGGKRVEYLLPDVHAEKQLKSAMDLLRAKH